MKVISFKIPLFNNIDFTIECLPEDTQIRGNASAIDEETDKEIENYIIDQLNNGNEWAWCRVKVTANYKGIEGVDYLGGCSYNSEKDFINNSGQYNSMRTEAYLDLVKNLESLNDI